MFSRVYLEKNNGTQIVHQYLKQNVPFGSDIQITSQQSSNNRDNSKATKQVHLRDFTLTNVRQNAKLSEIKTAIEKLKGYKIECQSLNLVDETDVTSEGYSQNIILQPLKEALLA